MALKRAMLVWHVRARQRALARQERAVTVEYGLQKIITIHAFAVRKTVSYTHLTLPTIYSV